MEKIQAVYKPDNSALGTAPTALNQASQKFKSSKLETVGRVQSSLHGWHDGKIRYLYIRL